MTNYVYDSLNRLTNINYTIPQGAGVEATPNMVFNYDNSPSSTTKGLLLSLTQGSNYSESYVYDSLNRLASLTRTIDTSNSYQTQYQYNTANQLTLEIYPSGKRVRMNHDSRGRMSGVDKVSSTGTVLTSYISSIAYNQASQVTSATIGDPTNNLSEVYSYSTDGRLQLSNQRVVKNGTDLMNQSYNYQAAAGSSGVGSVAGNSGQLMAMTATISGVAKNQSYSYDTVGRLKSASGWGGWTQNYSYDRWGNRTAVAGTNSQTVGIQTATNRISSVNSVNYMYDAAGELKSDGQHSYQYDGEGRIAKVDLGATATYSYDTANRRVKSVTQAGTTYYVWEGSQVIAEYSNAQQSGTGGVRYYHQDRLSTRMITNESGAVVGTQDHLPYGEDIGTSGVPEKHRFTTYERDAESGTDYAMNRQYSYVSGRFNRPDPVPGSLGSPQSWNRYVYAQNDPVNLIDPLGLNEEAPIITLSVTADAYPDSYRYFLWWWIFGGVTSTGGGDPGEGGGLLPVGSPDQTRKRRKLDPNSRECMELAQRIANILRDIIEERNRIEVNPIPLPETAPGPRRNSIQGHREILAEDEATRDKRIQEYNDKCGGPPPAVAPDRPPVILPPGFKYPKNIIPKTLPIPVRPTFPLILLPPGIIRCIVFGDCGNRSTPIWT